MRRAGTAYRHDGAISVTWSMTREPLGEVHSNILKKLLEPHRSVPRKRVTLVYRLMDSGTAARAVEADKRNAGWNARNAKNPSERVKAEMDKAATRPQGSRPAAPRSRTSRCSSPRRCRAMTQRHASTPRRPSRTSPRPHACNCAAVYGSQDSAFVGEPAARDRAPRVPARPASGQGGKSMSVLTRQPRARARGRAIRKKDREFARRDPVERAGPAWLVRSGWRPVAAGSGAAWSGAAPVSRCADCGRSPPGPEHR